MSKKDVVLQLQSKVPIMIIAKGIFNDFKHWLPKACITAPSANNFIQATILMQMICQTMPMISKIDTISTITVVVSKLELSNIVILSLLKREGKAKTEVSSLKNK
jgi:hypothetical protein